MAMSQSRTTGHTLTTGWHGWLTCVLPAVAGSCRLQPRARSWPPSGRAAPRPAPACVVEARAVCGRCME
jgi:hypothetical protein